MAINAKMVAELRDKSGAAMMDCKKALEATGGDLEAAFDHLRKTGLKNAEKRAGRSTGEGRVRAAFQRDGRSATMLQLTSETDFVANTEDFSRLLDQLLAHAAARKPATPEEMLRQPLAGETHNVDEALKRVSGKLGENMQVARVAHFENPHGWVGGYVHFNQKVGALVSVATDAPREKAEPFLKSLGMHVVNGKPLALSRADVPPETIDREKAVYRESEELKGKPDAVREKILVGKLDKFFASSVLEEQPWIHDDALSVKKALAAALGPNARIERFALFQVGQVGA